MRKLIDIICYFLPYLFKNQDLGHIILVFDWPHVAQCRSLFHCLPNLQTGVYLRGSERTSSPYRNDLKYLSLSLSYAIWLSFASHLNPSPNLYCFLHSSHQSDGSRTKNRVLLSLKGRVSVYKKESVRRPESEGAEKVKKYHWWLNGEVSEIWMLLILNREIF